MIGFEVNYWAVLVAGIVSVILGMLWYGPLFGRQWMSLMGFNARSMKSMKMSAGTAMALGFITSLVTAFVLAALLSAVGANTIILGIGSAVLIWLGFFATTALGVVLWEGKSPALYLLNTLYQLISLVLMSIVITAWM